jgi:predicted MFS family arabinose efflux permease
MEADTDEKRTAPVVTGAAPARARRFAVIASLYLVSDVGYSFFFGALNTILLRDGVSLGRLGLINLLGLLYFGRFVLGPMVDRIGHYRRWLMITQSLLVMVWLGLVPLDPRADLSTVLALTAAGLALSAVHDTAMNGLAVRLLPPEDRGLGNGIQSGMATLSIVLGSGGALFLYAHAGWSVTVGALAAVFLVPFAVLLFVAEPAREPAGREPLFSELVTLFRLPRIRAWTLLVLPSFALGGFMASAVLAPMMLAAHWSLDRIALVQGTLAGLAGLAAAFGTGVLVNRLGRRRSTRAVGVFWTGAIALLLPLSLGGSAAAVDIVAVLAVSAGYAGMAVCAFTVSMDLSRPASAATDFTAQVSVLGVLRLAINPVALAAAGAVGFPLLLGGSALLAAVGTWVTFRWLRGHRTSVTTSKELI